MINIENICLQYSTICLINTKSVSYTHLRAHETVLELTRKGEDKLYLILYSKPENGIIELPCSFEKKMVKAHMLHNKESIKTTQLKAQNKCLIDVSSICIEQTPVVIKLKGKWKL